MQPASGRAFKGGEDLPDAAGVRQSVAPQQVELVGGDGWKIRLGGLAVVDETKVVAILQVENKRETGSETGSVNEF